MAWWTDQTGSWDSTINSEDIRKPLNIFEQTNVTIRFACYPNQEYVKKILQNVMTDWKLKNEEDEKQKDLGWLQDWCLEVHWKAMSSKNDKTREREEGECDTFQVALKWQCGHLKGAVALG